MRAIPWLVALALAGCHGGVHRRGEWQAIGDVTTGTPAGEFLFSSTGADSPEIGVRLSMANFVRDRLALLAAGTYRYYAPESGSLSSGELQAGGRYYPPIDFHAWTVPVAPFLDALAGVMHATEDFPVAGTATNVTGELGGGIEFAVGKHASVLVGYHFRHLSNGRGDVPDNPGYNENQFFLGFGWRW